MEGLRVIGDPNEYAKRYHEADELLYIDTVASLYGRNNLSSIVERTSRDIFIPITVAGGIRSVEDVHQLFASGADKVGVNTAAIRRPELISEIANRYGSQAVTVSIEAKRTKDGWEAYTDCGRERTGRQVLGWIREAIDRGAGEILLTSVDQEGTLAGFDLELIRTCAGSVPVPFVVSGGCGTVGHISEALESGADAVAVASVLHYNKLTIGDIREHLESKFQNRRSQARGTETRSDSRV